MFVKSLDANNQKIIGERRLIRELIWINENTSEIKICAADTINESLFNWRLCINNIYNDKNRNDIYFLDVLFPKDYPFKPPKIKFVSEINNQHVDQEGNFSIAVLNNLWAPNITIEKLVPYILDFINNNNTNNNM